MIKKCCVVYLRQGQIFTQAFSIPTKGAMQLDGPVFVVSEKDNFNVIGQAVMNAWTHCREGVFHGAPPDHDNPLLQAAKVKSWRVMMKSSKALNVYILNEKINILPTRFTGGGYDHLNDKKIYLCEKSFDLETLGVALLEAFKLCE